MHPFPFFQVTVSISIVRRTLFYSGASALAHFAGCARAGCAHWFHPGRFANFFAGCVQAALADFIQVDFFIGRFSKNDQWKITFAFPVDDCRSSPVNRADGYKRESVFEISYTFHLIIQFVSVQLGLTHQTKRFPNSVPTIRLNKKGNFTIYFYQPFTSFY